MPAKYQIPVPPGMCACGEPLHYTDPENQKRMEGFVQTCGETVRVIVNGRKFDVPRHYIALHGLHAFDLLVYELFPEVFPETEIK